MHETCLFLSLFSQKFIAEILNVGEAKLCMWKHLLKYFAVFKTISVEAYKMASRRGFK